MKQHPIRLIAALLTALLLLPAGAQAFSVTIDLRIPGFVFPGEDDPLDAESIVTVAGDYELSGLYCELMTDLGIADGWRYFYYDADRSPAERIHWTTAEDMYTSVTLSFDIQNLGDEARTFADRFTARLEYQQDGQWQTLEGTAFQQTDSITDDTGYSARNLFFVPVEPGEVCRVDFLIDVPEQFHDLALDEESDSPLRIILRCDDGTEYTVDLRQSMVLRGYEDE